MYDLNTVEGVAQLEKDLRQTGSNIKRAKNKTEANLAESLTHLHTAKQLKG